ncbi:MAG: TfoX/Sxy family DNA transformation protein [Oscillospiraceae bacterium]
MTTLAYRAVPNMSDELVSWLNAEGIYTLEELQAVGSQEAFLRIRGRISERPFHTLCSLEAACRGVFKNELDQAARQELRRFYESLDA